MPADPLSDILSLLDARAVVTNGLHAAGDWAFQCPAPDGLKFVAVAQGRSRIEFGGADLVHLSEGDVLLLNGGSPYVLSSGPGVTPVCASTIFENSTDGIGRFGGDPDLIMIGGRVALDRERGNLLLDILPPVIHLPGHLEDAPAIRWMIDRLSGEIDGARPGSGLAVEQLTQLIVVQVLRTHLERGGPAVWGWLRGLADSKIALALSMMHGDPAHAWKVDELARALAMSRTAFAVRFKSVVGLAPLSYLTRWRMHLADRAFASGGQNVGAVGRSLGYTSEAAFSAAFKRERGVPPGVYQRTLAAMT